MGKNKKNLLFYFLICHSKQLKTTCHFRKYNLIITLILCLIIFPSLCFAQSSKLKTKLSNFYKKIEKKLDNESSDNASETVKTSAQIDSVPVIVASTTKNLKLEDFGFLPLEKVEIKQLFTQKLSSFDDENISYNGCQGFTTDGNFFYIALLSKGKEIEKHTKILKIRIEDYQIVKQKDLGSIGHSNSLTFNPKTQKIYSAPLWDNFKCIYEFDTNLENLKEIYLYNTDGSRVSDRQYCSVTYLPITNQYLVKFDRFTLGYFDYDFKLNKIIKVKQNLKIKNGNTSQAISSDGTNLYAVTNDLKNRPEIINYILIYDNSGNYIDKYVFHKELGVRVELQQILFKDEKTYGVAVFKGNFSIFLIGLKASL